MDESMIHKWNMLVDLVKQTTLSAQSDSPIWGLESNGQYSVKSFYKLINFCGVSSNIRVFIWKIKVPRISMFSCGSCIITKA